ncbi:MAG: RDD family protein, partial [Dehalococcoidia bacterium]
MNVRDTQTMPRGRAAPTRQVTAGRTSPARLARVWLRLAAYVVDWLVTVIIASVLISIGGLQLYLASDRGTQDPPDASVYVFLGLALLALPIWMVITLVGWSSSGRSIGKLATGLRIVDRFGRSPGFVRSLIRFTVYCLENVPIVVAPAVAALWLTAEDALPVWSLLVAALLLLGSVVAL